MTIPLPMFQHTMAHVQAVAVLDALKRLRQLVDGNDNMDAACVWLHLGMLHGALHAHTIAVRHALEAAQVNRFQQAWSELVTRNGVDQWGSESCARLFGDWAIAGCPDDVEEFANEHL